MGSARIRVSFELLREALHLPAGTDIRFATTTDYGRDMELTLLHPDIVDVPRVEGELPPLLCPTFRRQAPVVFERWNQGSDYERPKESR